jgi:hypothetical protein
LIVRANWLDIANIQSFHIAQVVCSFMSVANPSNVGQSFRNAGLSRITADEQLLCMVTPETARCLFDRDKVLNPLASYLNPAARGTSLLSRTFPGSSRRF